MATNWCQLAYINTTSYTAYEQGRNILAKKAYKNTTIITALTLIALAVIGAALYVKSNQPTAQVDTSTHNTTEATKQQAASSPPNSTGSAEGKGSAATANSTGSTSGDSLPAPTGELLNKRVISLSSTDPAKNSSLESVCQTIANASCDIKLTSGSTTKLVGAKPTGGGTVIINWDANTVGVTPGTWVVQAVVTQNGQTGTSHSETLVVQP